MPRFGRRGNQADETNPGYRFDFAHLLTENQEQDIQRHHAPVRREHKLRLLCGITTRGTKSRCPAGQCVRNGTLTQRSVCKVVTGLVCLGQLKTLSDSDIYRVRRNSPLAVAFTDLVRMGASGRRVALSNDRPASMGQLFPDAYHATDDPQFFQAADKGARTLIWGQLDCGLELRDRFRRRSP